MRIISSIIGLDKGIRICDTIHTIQIISKMLEIQCGPRRILDLKYFIGNIMKTLISDFFELKMKRDILEVGEMW